MTLRITNSSGLYATAVVIVDGGSTATPYTTIAAGLLAADDIGVTTVFVRDGTYVEDLTLIDGISIVADTFGETSIVGVHTPPTAGTSGITFKNIELAHNSDIFNSAGAGTPPITLEGCEINLTGGHLFDLASWTGDLNVFNCIATDSGGNDGFINNGSGSSDVTVINSEVGGTLGAGTTGSGTFTANHSTINAAIDFLNQTDVTHTLFRDTITANVNSIMNLRHTTHLTGTASAINMLSSNQFYLSNAVINSTNTNAITGSTGTITLTQVAFEESFLINAAVTVEPAITKIGGLSIPEVSGDSFIGSTALVGGTITVNTTSVKASSHIQLTAQTRAGNIGFVAISAIVAGTSFSITSSDILDTNTIGWLIINPV